MSCSEIIALQSHLQYGCGICTASAGSQEPSWAPMRTRHEKPPWVLHAALLDQPDKLDQQLIRS